MLEGPREKLLYVIGIHTDPEKADVLCTVDVDPDSPTYCQVKKIFETYRNLSKKKLNSSVSFFLSDNTQTENAVGWRRTTSLRLEYL